MNWLLGWKAPELLAVTATICASNSGHWQQMPLSYLY
jgi:hypothetical protein